MNIDLMNLLYITIIILFLILLINKNNIDTFLFDFNLEPKLCKQKCHDIPGDCLYQCFNTVMSKDGKDYYTELKNISPTLSYDLFQKIDNDLGQDQEWEIFPDSSTIIDLWVKSESISDYDKSSIVKQILAIFLSINNNTSKLVCISYFDLTEIIEEYEKTISEKKDEVPSMSEKKALKSQIVGEESEFNNQYHFVIFSRSNHDGEETLYMIDPKNKIISKNSDIFNNPFQDIDNADTYNWSIWPNDNMYIQLTALNNLDKSDEVVHLNLSEYVYDTQFLEKTPKLSDLELEVFPPDQWCNINNDDSSACSRGGATTSCQLM